MNAKWSIRRQTVKLFADDGLQSVPTIEAWLENIRYTDALRRAIGVIVETAYDAQRH